MTSHVIRHYKRTHENKTQVHIRTQMQLNAKTNGNLGFFSYDDFRTREEVTDYMVRADLLFTYVEKHDFYGMVQIVFNPQFKEFSSSTTKRDITKTIQKNCNEFLFFSVHISVQCRSSGNPSIQEKKS